MKTPGWRPATVTADADAPGWRIFWNSGSPANPISVTIRAYPVLSVAGRPNADRTATVTTTAPSSRLSRTSGAVSSAGSRSDLPIACSAVARDTGVPIPYGAAVVGPDRLAVPPLPWLISMPGNRNQDAIACRLAGTASAATASRTTTAAATAA